MRYRVDVVNKNIKAAFPGKTDAEKETIIKAYYKHLCYNIVESLKLLSITNKEIQKRFTFLNPAFLDQLYKEHNTVVVLMGHTGNWEWFNYGIQLHGPFALSAIYLPVKSKTFNRLMLHLRTRKGASLINMNTIVRHMIETRHQKRVYAFIADQTPPNNPGVRWLRFLHQDTPVYEGAEQLAPKFNAPVIYGSMHRDKKGHFIARAELISTPPHTVDITQAFYTLLENDIYAYPAQWLWSHRRWKHSRMT